MRNGENNLNESSKKQLDEDKNKKVLTVWFNAWRYEQEENYGIAALLKTIAIELDKSGHYKEVKSQSKCSSIMGKSF
jgi:predicted KAP-like P-loop ATPase